MSDPAIKAALDAAARELCAASSRRRSDGAAGCVCPQEGRQCCLGPREDAAAAVAAFHRALQGHYITHGLDGIAMTSGWFAAAVEEAARHG